MAKHAAHFSPVLLALALLAGCQGRGSSDAEGRGEARGQGDAPPRAAGERNLGPILIGPDSVVVVNRDESPAIINMIGVDDQLVYNAPRDPELGVIALGPKGPQRIAKLDGNVYKLRSHGGELWWIEEGDPSSKLVRVSLRAGEWSAPEVVSHDIPPIRYDTQSYAISATHVYIPMGAEGMLRVAKTGADEPDIVAAEHGAFEAIATADTLYWLSSHEGREGVLRVAKAGELESSTVLVDASRHPARLAATASAVYWTSGATASRARTLVRHEAEGQPETLLTSPGPILGFSVGEGQVVLKLEREVLAWSEASGEFQTLAADPVLQVTGDDAVATVGSSAFWSKSSIETTPDAPFLVGRENLPLLESKLRELPLATP